jgi:PPK2 family polyphosphate:nucleotide phosphotransferase
MKNPKRANDEASTDGATKPRPSGRSPKARGGIVVVRSGDKIRLADVDPGAKPALDKEEAAERVEALRDRLAELQQALYGEHKRSLLMVVQAMDTGGKDGAIKKICSGLDPNGVQLTNFKVPSAEERDHDFLWRIHASAPRKGSIGIWNRSHYEDVLVPRVHKQIDERVWRERCEEINAFERLLCRNGVTLVKFFLHISKEEQKARLEARLRDPQKLWKFNTGDLRERALWDEYQRAYEDAINECATDCAPWHIVPADRKWARNLWMLETVVQALDTMQPQYPPAEFDPTTIVIE